MESAVGFQRACGAEDRLPLGGINCPADIGHTRQENVILDVENPCGLVRPLEEFPKADEFISLVTDKGRGCKSLKEMGLFLDLFKKLMGSREPDFACIL